MCDGEAVTSVDPVICLVGALVPALAVCKAADDPRVFDSVLQLSAAPGAHVTLRFPGTAPDLRPPRRAVPWVW